LCETSVAAPVVEEFASDGFACLRKGMGAYLGMTGTGHKY